MRKPRSILETKLTEEQQCKLADWLIGGMQYAPAVIQIEKEFGLKVGKGGVETFWQNVCSPLLLSRRSKAVQMANAIGATAAEVSSIQKGLIAQLQQKAFEILLQANPDPNEVFLVISQALKVRDQDLKAEDIAFKRNKFEFDAAKACLKHLPTLRQIASDGKLDQNEKINRVRQMLFGELPKVSEATAPK